MRMSIAICHMRRSNLYYGSYMPYAYSYCSNYTTIAVHKQHKYIGIANTVLLFFLDHELYP